MWTHSKCEMEMRNEKNESSGRAVAAVESAAARLELRSKSSKWRYIEATRARRIKGSSWIFDNFVINENKRIQK